MEASGVVPPTQPPAEEATGHAPAAAEQERVIIGNAGLGEQQPVEAEQSQNTPLINGSAPQAQSGVPLHEDREAGVVANEDMRGEVAPPHSEVGSAPAGAPVTQGEPEAAPAEPPAAAPESPPAE